MDLPDHSTATRPPRHPMTVGQRALWFDQQAAPASNASNLGGCVRFARPLDVARLDRALAIAGERHPMLRARFDLADGEAVWCVADEPMRCSVAPPATRTEAEAAAWCGDFLLRPYDLASEAPFRFGIVPLSSGCLLAIGCHHIAADLHSLVALVQELDLLHREDATPAATEDDPDAIARGQHEYLLGPSGVRATQWWRDHLAQVAPLAGLGDLDTAVPQAVGSAGRIDFALAADCASRVRDAAARCGSTPFAFLLAGFQVALAHRLHRRDVIVGVPFAGRRTPESQLALGYFVNLLPVVLRAEHGISFETLLRDHSATLRGALWRARVPYATIAQDQPALAGGLAASFAYQSTSLDMDDGLARVALGLPGGRLALDGQVGELVPLAEAQAQFPLDLAIAPVADGFAGTLRFDTTRITPDAARRFLDHWVAFVDACSRTPQAPVGELLEPASRRATTLAEAIDAALAAHAGTTALRDANRELTYAELDAASRDVAAALRARGFGHGDRVGVIGDGGIDTVVHLVGVLRSGAAFVPIDTATPSQRVQELAAIARLAFVLGPERFETTADLPLHDRAVAPSDPAWLMFTSGTTGRSKAAVVPHSAALAHARGIAARLDLDAADRVLQFASLSFDEHAEEIFPTLLAGACIVCVPGLRHEDPETLLRHVRRHGVTVLHLPTSWWHVWCDELPLATEPLPPTLRLVNAGGEAASRARLATWAASTPTSMRWVNSYGLTEAAVTSLVWELDRATLDEHDAVPVGTPLPGTRVRIVDEMGRDVEAGATGELLLGGDGIGTGYFEAPELTAARFFEAQGVRWLRTGDLAHVRRGQVVVTGRCDRVVKVHGVRIDLAEVERLLQRVPGVEECAVTACASGSGLQAHVVRRADSEVGELQLRQQLHAFAPGSSLPLRVDFLAALPRTPGRKPDYGSLSGRRTIDEAAERHLASMRETVAAIFRRLLERDVVDDHADFFALGGHSLLAMRVVAAVRRELGVEFSVAEFLAAPTVRHVAAHCAARSPARMPGHAEAASSGGGNHPPSQAQRRLLATTALAETAELESECRLRIVGRLTQEQVTRAWTAVLAAHPLLVADIDPEGVTYRAPGESEIAVRIMPALPGTTRSRHLLANPAADATARVQLTWFRLSPTEHVLAIRARLLAVDGGSVPALLDTFLTALAGEKTSRTSVSYANFVEAESRWLASPACETARKWWTAELADAPAATRIGRSPAQPFGPTRRVRCGLPSTLSRQVHALAASQSTTPFTVVLSAFLVLLARWTGDDELLVGLPVSLRDRLGVPDACGPTLNPLPLRASVRREASFTQLVEALRGRLAETLEHAPLPWEAITGTCATLRAGPLPVQFVGLPGLCAPSQRGGFAFEECTSRDGTGAIPLLASVRITSPAAIAMEFEFRRDVLDDGAAVRLLRTFRCLLASLCAEPTRRVGDARMLARRELQERIAVRPRSAAPGAPMLLHAGLLAQARREPDRVAIVCGSLRMSYGQLESATRAHAARLVAAGLETGDRVIVASRLGLPEVVAACAVLRAGGIYVPVRHDLAADDAARLAARVGARLATGDAVLTTDWRSRTGARWVPVVDQDVVAIGEPDRDVPPDASAYILFTSGSTGEPKGVEIAHAAAMGTINEMLARFAIGSDSVFHRQAALDFDLSVFDIFGAFTAGATVVIPPAEGAADAFAWARGVREHGVSVWNSVPSALDMLLVAAGDEGLPSLRYVLASGDWIGLDLPERTRAAAPASRFIALGGATEASIWSNFEEVREVDPAWRSIPYGRPLGGQSMFVADADGCPVPRGVAGEIRIGGAGLARGYWGDPERSKERFPLDLRTGARVYRTGDRGRHLDDGRIEFLGRLDARVKVRGHWVDPATVEAVIASHPAVARVIVAPLRSNDTEAAEGLATWVQPRPGPALDLAQLRRHASGQLPAAWLPSAWTLIDELPLTANGKVDRLRLRHSPSAATSPAGAWTTPTEARVAVIWNDLLPGVPLRPDDDFFALGGHSLLAVRLLAAVRGGFGREVSLPRWLEQPTIAHLAALLDETASPSPATRGRSIGALRPLALLPSDLQVAPRRTDPGALLVTGATGLIGSRLVARLLASTECEVICLVRDAARAAALRATLAPTTSSARLARLQTVEGRLDAHRFGLDAAAFDALALRTARVFHVGARLNLLAPYDTLAATNVQGTLEAVRLAAAAGAVLCHVSSVGVLPYGAGRVVREDDPIDVEGRLLTGYCETKWVAEQLVREAMARGLRAMVFRPGLTVAETAPDAERDLLACLLAVSREAGCLPASDLPVDVVDADYVATAIAHIGCDSRATGRTFHLAHPSPRTLLELAARDGALPLRSFADWQQRVAAATARHPDTRLAALGALVAGHDEAEITPARIDCSRTLAFLRGTGIACDTVAAIVARTLLQAA